MPIPNIGGTYVPPGVYLGLLNSPNVPNVGLHPAVPGFYGPSVGYQSYIDSPLLSSPTPISTPTAPTVTPNGTVGTTTYSYEITALNLNGQTAASPIGTTTTGNAVLSVTNYNALSFAAVTGATSYDIYRNNGTAYVYIGTTTGTTFSDTGQVATAATPPTSNTTGGQPVQLTQLGINPSSVVVSSTDGNTIYANNTDYVLTVGAGADGNIATLADNTLTISLPASLGKINAGTQVTVTYNYTNANYFTPQQFSSFRQVQQVFGNSFNTTTGALVSPLSFAAQIAFQEGASTVVLAPTSDINPTITTRANLSAALQNLAMIPTVSIAVPLPVGMTGTIAAPGDIENVALDLENFVNTQSNDYNQDMVGIVGYETSVTIAPDTIAEFINDRRVMEAWPNQLLYYNGYSNQTITVGGYYLAAAYAGSLCSRPPQVPLTKKHIKSFAGIPGPLFASMSNSLKNQYSASGVAVTELSRSGVMSVRHGVTTNPSGLINREISIVRAEDALEELLLDSITQANLIGGFIDKNTKAVVQGVISGALHTAQLLEIIIQSQGLTVTEQLGDPSIIAVTFAYLPAIPLNYITVSYSINLTLGQTSASATTAA